jgi:hypothetical protein
MKDGREDFNAETQSTRRGAEKKKEERKEKKRWGTRE